MNEDNLGVDFILFLFKLHYCCSCSTVESANEFLETFKKYKESGVFDYEG